MLQLNARIDDNKIEMVMNKGKIDLEIMMSSILVKTNVGDERFPNILHSVKSNDQEELAHISIHVNEGIT